MTPGRFAGDALACCAGQPAAWESDMFVITAKTNNKHVVRLTVAKATGSEKKLMKLSIPTAITGGLLSGMKLAL
jgi:hypothetical protein